MQFYIVLNPELPGVYFESSAFAAASNRLDKAAEKWQIKSVYLLFSYDAQDDLLPEEYQGEEIPWFEPQEGIDWLEVVIARVSEDPVPFKNVETLLGDLNSCLAVLHKAKAAGSKWHFAMDI